MMMFFLPLIAVAAGLWVAYTYKEPGSIGLTAVGITGLFLLDKNQTDWEIFSCLVVLVLFVIGMLVSAEHDDLFHEGALIFSMSKWFGVYVIGPIFGWDKWSEQAEVPMPLVAIGVIGVIVLIVMAFRGLSSSPRPQRT